MDKQHKEISTPSLWSLHFANARFRWMAICSALFLAFCIKYITSALAVIDLQSGVQLYDPIHAVLPASLDLSTIIFFLTYSSVSIVVIDVIMKSPMQVIRLGFAIGLMKILRSFSMFLVPLEPPIGIIPLQDPLVSFMTPNHVVALRDLFFSGHCATMMILYLVAVSPLVKNWMKVILVVVPLLILWQRVHYTIDVVAGLAVGMGIYVLIKNTIKLKNDNLAAY